MTSVVFWNFTAVHGRYALIADRTPKIETQGKLQLLVTQNCQITSKILPYYSSIIRYCETIQMKAVVLGALSMFRIVHKILGLFVGKSIIVFFFQSYNVMIGIISLI